MYRKIATYAGFVLILLALFSTSCKKEPNDPVPIPPWEDYSEDSVTLVVTVKTLQGTVYTGASVYLYLSQDSLNQGLMIRPPNSTDGAGKAHFNRLYPRKYYGNCIANSQEGTLRAQFNINLPPKANRDTTVIVR